MGGVMQAGGAAPEDNLLREKVEVLNGDRARPRAAVRLEDLAGLLQVPPKLQAQKAAGAAPTKAEYDKLLEDVHDLHNRLLAVAQALGTRMRP